mmetsp:Transcript_53455/g.64440  ORF Transcript_53455/g.64440 Transcript_53455/m.64440 type:complete len:1294 (+) Transcript_53455:176-4057(+)
MGPFGETKNKTNAHKQRDDLKRNVSVTEHKTDLDELLQRLGVDPRRGLSSSDVKRLLDQVGCNLLTPPKQKPKWVRFLEELTGFFSLLLWAGAILCFIGYSIDRSEDHLFLGIVLVFVVVVTGIFSFVQNSKSESLMNSFKSMLPPKVKVLREGSTDEVLSTHIVPGDVVFVEGGDLIPADLRVLECSDNFQVDNAALTGESEPQKRKRECTHDDPLETQNLCFFGTQVPEGSAKGVVIATGDNTVMGRIAALAMSTKKEQTPINKEIHHFILIISGIAMFLGVLFFILNILIGTPYIENLVFMIGIIVANVPEGLLATVTVCLTLTAQRMHAKMVLVKNLEGVETLGSTSCICSDKTGTLTQNIMTVAKVVYGGEASFMTEDAPSSFTAGRKSYDLANECFRKLLRCSALCNVATFNESSKWEYEEDGVSKKLDASGNPIPCSFKGFLRQGDGSKLETILWKPVGNASECAMIKLVQSEATENKDFDVDHLRKEYPVKFVIPFNSKNKYQVHIHEMPNSQKQHVVQMKGAPERIISRCTHMLLNGKIVKMTPEERQNIEEQQEALSANGLRCLGFAEKELDPAVYHPNYQYATDTKEHNSPNFPIGEMINPTVEDSTGRIQNPVCTEGLVFLGLMALIDPPRPAVPPAVEKCKTAGVKVIMVTGDHPVTAQAIAYKVGILWSKTRGDMEKDNLRYGRSPGDVDYENPDDATAIVVPGHTISVDMSEEQWDFILGHTQIVFARTSPQQKLVIVENNQRQGHIVAVTGDGVNDSPAIKKADIGIAMGIMGSEVSKNAADMILLDDNFASIVKGVEEGRLIFDNLKKSIAYTIQSNIPEITPFLAFILFAIPLPLTTFLILAIDLGTDMIPAISMAYELPEADIMMRPPRNSKTDRLVTPRMISFSYGQIGFIQAMAGFFTYMVVLNDFGYPPSVLMNRGHSEMWGKQPFFCKFHKGHYVDINGIANPNLDPTYDAPTREFPFWFEASDGYIQDCGYPIFHSGSESDPGDGFQFQDSLTYNTGTRGKRAPTLESYLANEQQGYFEYVPWKGKTSQFWNNQFLYWDTNDKNGPMTLGTGVERQLYFTGRPAGLYSLCAANDGQLGHYYEDKSAVLRGAQFPADAIAKSEPLLFEIDGKRICDNEPAGATMTDRHYNATVFCNGQSNEPEHCRLINGYDDDDKPGFTRNRFQAFYCKNQCGQLLDVTDPSDIPFCDATGVTRCGPFVNGTCDNQCHDLCYPPPVFGDVTFGGANGENGYKQCLNVASSEVAYEALKHAQGAFFWFHRRRANRGVVSL